MLKYFLKSGRTEQLFDGLHISSNEKIYSRNMGKISRNPTKNAEGLNFDTAKYQMVELIAREAERFPFLAKDTKLIDRDRKNIRVLSRHLQMDIIR